MIVFLNTNGTLEFQRLDVPLVTLLFDSFQEKNPSISFFKNYFLPLLQEKNHEFAKDWKEYIAPEVSSLLEQSYAMVLADLAQIKKEDHDQETEVTLTIPPLHREAWLRTLSIARFAVAKSLQEKKSEQLLFQQDFLTVLQQCLVETEEKK